MNALNLPETYPARAVRYVRDPHAGHCMFTHRPLHDLEIWIAVQSTTAPRPDCVPPDATMTSGFIDDGVQHVVFQRAVLPSDYPACALCRRVNARAKVLRP